ncbi:MAG: ParB/RepB/Spo0J family partition protein [Rhodospirillales bacterium]|nr:ParB/RepB/Spo0J family partition protein [Rhodospirillales bacterium]
MTAKAKLTEVQIAEIRALAAGDPPIAKTEIARRFGVHHSQISRLLAGKAHGGQVETKADPGPLAMIPYNWLLPPTGNPRTIFNEEKLAALAETIDDRGVLEPLRVRPEPDGGFFRVEVGERRHRAIGRLVTAGRRQADWPIPCVVVAADRDSADVLLDQLAENIGRADMEPLDEADAFSRLVNGEPPVRTADIARAVGRTQRYVQARLALVRHLDPKVRDALAAGKIKLAQAEALTDADKAEQIVLLPVIVAGQLKTEADVRSALVNLRAELADHEDIAGSHEPLVVGRDEGDPGPLPTVAEMMAGEASGGADDSLDDERAEACEEMAAEAEAAMREGRGYEPPPKANAVRQMAQPGPANDTASAAFPPFRHFRVLAAEPDSDNMPKTMVIENVITNKRAHFTRTDIGTAEAEE